MIGPIKLWNLARHCLLNKDFFADPAWKVLSTAPFHLWTENAKIRGFSTQATWMQGRWLYLHLGLFNPFIFLPECKVWWESFNTFHRSRKSPAYCTGLCYLFIGKDHQSTSAYKSPKVYGMNNPQIPGNIEVRQALRIVSTSHVTCTVAAQIPSAQFNCGVIYPDRVNTEYTLCDSMLERSATGIKRHP